MLLQLAKNMMGIGATEARRSTRRGAAGRLPVTDAQTGFIQHRYDIPLDYKRIEPAPEEDPLTAQHGNVGLLFESGKRVKPGEFIEVALGLQNKPEKLRGKVVMVRERDGYYEIGLWLATRADASRMRILEQSCYIEDYIKEKKLREGPFALNRDRAAQEWIRKYAADLPG
ncbi:MAG: hypothetical protein OXD47_08195 [Gammaproteobacteria bacterium]|nr:hypothetical protein [Gammaproteobacteria bacterium]MCY4210273.1 hypothetical protein [Gammaproteobacteria bacterium]MCY4281540.1 hypothetical protein [Gammaproteobacteria bacterium]MCY4338764.1 hypothetical protein [Gammaproteobacteria bacterium]